MVQCSLVSLSLERSSAVNRQQADTQGPPSLFVRSFFIIIIFIIIVVIIVVIIVIVVVIIILTIIVVITR